MVLNALREHTDVGGRLDLKLKLWTPTVVLCGAWVSLGARMALSGRGESLFRPQARLALREKGCSTILALEEVMPLVSIRTGIGPGKGRGPCQVLCGKEPYHSSVSVWPQEAENKLMAMKP